MIRLSIERRCHNIGIIFRWFKGYEIEDVQDYYDFISNIRYFNGDSTTYSAGNVIKVKKLFEKYNNVGFPTISETQTDYSFIFPELKLFSQEEMIKMCQIILEKASDE